MQNRLLLLVATAVAGHIGCTVLERLDTTITSRNPFHATCVRVRVFVCVCVCVHIPFVLVPS